jgi:hypothetical protein
MAPRGKKGQIEGHAKAFWQGWQWQWQGHRSEAAAGQFTLEQVKKYVSARPLRRQPPRKSP